MWTKFVRLVQNDMPTAVIWSKLKPGVKFQYRERLFFKTEVYVTTHLLCSEKNSHSCFLAYILEKVTNLNENFRQNS